MTTFPYCFEHQRKYIHLDLKEVLQKLLLLQSRLDTIVLKKGGIDNEGEKNEKALQDVYPERLG